MQSLKGVFFDLDGTLLDSIDGIVASFLYAFEKHGLAKPSRPDIIMKIGEPLPAQMLFFAKGDLVLANQLVAAYREHNSNLISDFPLYPHAKECLSALRGRGFKTGLVTSKHRISAQVSLEARGVVNLLDVIVTADDTAKHKPNGEPIVFAAKKMKLNAADIAYVGDSIYDIRAAHDAGSLAVAALWGPFPRRTLEAERPHLYADSLEDLLDLPQFQSLTR